MDEDPVDGGSSPSNDSKLLNESIGASEREDMSTTSSYDANRQFCDQREVYTRNIHNATECSFSVAENTTSGSRESFSQALVRDSVSSRTPTSAPTFRFALKPASRLNIDSWSTLETTEELVPVFTTITGGCTEESIWMSASLSLVYRLDVARGKLFSTSCAGNCWTWMHNANKENEYSTTTESKAPQYKQMLVSRPLCLVHGAKTASATPSDLYFMISWNGCINDSVSRPRCGNGESLRKATLPISKVFFINM
ncbi:hypothetical protein EDC04DRAFT_3091847 [Pisolithus marmoratus]|nr:hypothetical protein EDC04DRAFT_3091847 [Pisolithus marmoratus]